MNRRGFLSVLGAGAAFDPERLLYVPGRKLISIPKPVVQRMLYVWVRYDDGTSEHVELPESAFRQFNVKIHMDRRGLTDYTFLNGRASESHGWLNALHAKPTRVHLV